MKFVITGGGTGGHITPALAISESIKERIKGSECIFIGRMGGNENKAVIDEKIPLIELNVKGIERKLSTKNIKNLWLAIDATKKAKEILKEFNPDFVIGTGGYVSWPVIHAAQKLKIPSYIHESNAYPGLVTRLVGKKCQAVFLNYEKCGTHLRRCKLYTVGNPIRSSIKYTSRKASRMKLGIKNDEFLVISFGGSGGSEKINECIAKIMLEGYDNPRIKHIHATGKKYYERYRGRYSENCTIWPYIDDMATMLAASDLVICRCGAMTLSEVAARGIPAILIPSPNVTNNHQYENGNAIVSMGGAKMIQEKDLTSSALKHCIMKILLSDKERKQLSKCIEKFAIFNSDKMICDVIISHFKSNKHGQL